MCDNPTSKIDLLAVQKQKLQNLACCQRPIFALLCELYFEWCVWFLGWCIKDDSKEYVLGYNVTWNMVLSGEFQR